MQILAIDVGTGTQDIFLYDSQVDIENGFKLILPSPTMMVFHKIKEATRRGETLVLSGVVMGGGPSAWATEAHMRAGLKVYATPSAALSFNDDLNAVREMGIELVEEGDLAKLAVDACHVELRDFNYGAIRRTFEDFGVKLNRLQAVAVAVFDHGNSPPDYSDRQFRFDYLDQRIRETNRLSAFAYKKDDIPQIMTRLQAVADSAKDVESELVVMDTAPAAVLGATYDPQAQTRRPLIIANVGNFHTLAFRIGEAGIDGVFEHHTGLIDTPKLDDLIGGLAEGTLTHAEVFGHHGHGALVYNTSSLVAEENKLPLVVTGPRRGMMKTSRFAPHFAAPFGDMMIAGCFGMLHACADLLPEVQETVMASLEGRGENAAPPWESNE